MRVLEVTDGGFDYPRETLIPPDLPADVQAQYPATMPIPYRPLLVEISGMKVLLDTGAGPMAPATGQLPDNLRAAGVLPQEIDLVLLSHAHTDHIGGLLDNDGNPAFPNARILIGRTEYEFWRDSGIRQRLGSGTVYGSEVIENVIGTWLDKYIFGQNLAFELIGPGEVIPGLEAVAAPGHTPGQLAFLVTADDEQLLYTSDAFVIADHIANPEWTSVFDLDPNQTIETRRALRDRAAADRYRVAHYHVGGFGRVVRHGSGYAWEAEQDAQPALRSASQAT